MAVVRLLAFGFGLGPPEGATREAVRALAAKLLAGNMNTFTLGGYVNYYYRLVHRNHYADVLL